MASAAAPASVDASYNPGLNGPVFTLALQSNGKLVAGGAFTSVAGTAQPFIARLNVDGSHDSAFNPENPPAQPVTIVMAAADKVYAASGDGLRCYDTNGVLAWLFPLAIKALAVDASQQPIIGGQFTRIDNQYHRNIARLLPSGEVDPSFVAAAGCCAGDGVFALLATDHLLAGGRFQTVNATSGALNLASLKADSSIDSTFSGSADATVLALSAIPDGRFMRVSERTAARHLPNGAIDPAFTPLHTVSGDDHFAAVATAVDQTVFVGGSFTVSGATHVARLNADGSLDSTFAVQPDGAVQAIVVGPDGNAILGGSFTHVNGTPQYGISRLQLNSATAAAQAPRLQIAAVNGQIVISWPASTVPYSLQSRAVTETEWAAVPGLVTTTGSVSFMTTDQSSNPGRVYRLLKAN